MCVDAATIVKPNPNQRLPKFIWGFDQSIQISGCKTQRVHDVHERMHFSNGFGIHYRYIERKRSNCNCKHTTNVCQSAHRERAQIWRVRETIWRVRETPFQAHSTVLIHHNIKIKLETDLALPSLTALIGSACCGWLADWLDSLSRFLLRLQYLFLAFCIVVQYHSKYSW